MRRYITYFYFYIFCLFSFYGKAGIIDSLQNSLKLAKDEIEKAHTLCALAKESEGEEMFKYANEALNLSLKINYQSGIAESHLLLGKYYFFREDFSASLEHCMKALKLSAETLKDDSLSAIACRYIGYNYFQNEPKISLEYYNKSLDYSRKVNNQLLQSYALSAIGNLYESWHDGKSALNYYEQSLNIREKMGSVDELVSSLIETARAYNRISEYDKSLALIMQALKISEKDGKNIQNLIYLYQMLGYDYSDRQKDYKTALRYFLKSYELVKKNNFTDKNNIVSIKPVAEAYFNLGDYRQSAEYFKLYVGLSEENQKKIDREFFESQYAIEKEIEKQKLLLKDAEIEKQKLIAQREKNLRNTFIIGSIILLVISFFVFRLYHQNKKLNLTLEEKVREKTYEMEETSKKLQEKVKELDMFFYKASHDLKGPLSSVSGLVSVAKLDVTDKNALHYFDLVEASNRKLINFLTELTDIVRVTQGKLQPEKINLQKLTEEIFSSLQHIEKSKGMKLNCDIKNGEFYSDKAVLNSILQNLILNGINYRRDVDNSFVSVTTHEINDALLINVADNGIGIEEENLEKVFDMFYRANPNSKGSGLGLYIVRTAVDKIKGTITLESEPGKGTIFRISIPKLPE